MKRMMGLVLLACLLFNGCASVFDGHYVSVTPYENQGSEDMDKAVAAADFEELCTALRTMTHNGVESGVISVARYDQNLISQEVPRAIAQVRAEDPITAYAVEQIEFEVGANAGQPAVAVQISYVHDRTQIRKIRSVETMGQAQNRIALELASYSAGVVLQVEQYEETDLAQWAEDYADLYPELVMECPEVTVDIYPESGESRVVELKFSYQNGRDDLRTMQSHVSPIFAASELYVGGDGAPREKFSQLYAFLMERFENYTVETSLTPAYSLLIHGVGDAEAFASVYAAMCRQAGLECMSVGGTRNGSAWYWNIVRDGDRYYHVDLLQCSANGTFRECADGEMGGYVWDYSAYPVCGVDIPETAE